MRKFILLLSALLLFSFPVFADVILDFGVYTANKPSTVQYQFRPILHIVEDRMGKILGENVKINVHLAHSYDEGIDHVVKGKVDFARFGPSTYVTAKRINPDIKIIVMEERKGEKDFYGIIIVHLLSHVEKIEELKGSSFAFGNESSTVGRYLSQRYLYQHGITDKSLEKYEYLGRHDRVAMAVGLGQFDAGALNGEIFDKLQGKGVPIREIARFDSVNNPWIARGDLPPKIYEALQNSLLQITSDDCECIKNLGFDVFIEGSDENYLDIRNVMENNKKFFNSRDNF